MPYFWLNVHVTVFEAKNVVVHHSCGVDVCLIVAIHGAQTKQRQHLFSQCLQPLQTYNQIGIQAWSATISTRFAHTKTFLMVMLLCVAAM